MRDYYGDITEDWGQEDIRELRPDDVLEPDDEQLHDWRDEYGLAIDRVIDNKLESMAAMKEVTEAIVDVQSETGMKEQLDKEFIDKLNQEHREAEPLDRHELLDQAPGTELPENNFDKEREEWERLHQTNQGQSDPWNVFGRK